MPKLTMMCRVTFEHRMIEGGVRDTVLTFAVAATARELLPRAAITDALRWYKHRQRSVPEYFGTLLCVKAYEYTIHFVDENGVMLPNTFLPFFEWKCDWGGTIEQYMDMRLK